MATVEISETTEVASESDFENAEFLLWLTDDRPKRITVANLIKLMPPRLVGKISAAMTLTASFQAAQDGSAAVSIDTSDIGSTNDVMFKFVFFETQGSITRSYACDVSSKTLAGLGTAGTSVTPAAGNALQLWGPHDDNENKGIRIGLNSSGDVFIVQSVGTGGRITALAGFEIYRL